MYFRIKEARKAANMTQKELAEKLGIKISTLSGYEIGAHDPKSNTLAKIAAICNTTVDFLLGIDASGESDERIDQAESEEHELLGIYRDLNVIGQSTLMNVARGLASNPDMKRGGGSSTETA